jgi:uncharacterized SAM-binding protein YcdF (DUF218 family)
MKQKIVFIFDCIFKMNKITKVYLFFAALGLSCLLYAHTHFVYNTFYKPSRLFKEALVSKPYDAIIVPGFPVDGGSWGFVMKWRVNWSVFLYKSGITKNIIYSGGAVYTPYTEAIIMALYAEKMGVPKEHIFTEINAEHTTENLYYSHQLAVSKGFTKVGFATDPFQSMQIEPYIEKYDLHVSLIPSVIDIMKYIRFEDYAIAAYQAYQLNFISIMERETDEERSFYSKGGRIKN